VSLENVLVTAKGPPKLSETDDKKEIVNEISTDLSHKTTIKSFICFSNKRRSLLKNLIEPSEIFFKNLFSKKVLEIGEMKEVCKQKKTMKNIRQLSYQQFNHLWKKIKDTFSKKD